MRSKICLNRCGDYFSFENKWLWGWFAVMTSALLGNLTTIHVSSNVCQAESLLVSNTPQEVEANSDDQDSNWIQLRDGSLLSGFEVKIEQIDVQGIKLATRLLTWDSVHSVHLNAEHQAAADYWLAELGKPWAMAVYRLKLRDWYGAYTVARHARGTLMSIPNQAEVANHAAWMAIEQCVWLYHQQRGDWELAMLEYLSLTLRMQSMEPTDVSAQWHLGETPKWQAEWSVAMPPIVLSSEQAARQIDRIRIVATKLIASRHARGCWYIAALAQAAGDVSLAQQCREAAAANWAKEATEELVIWQQIEAARQSLEEQRAVEALQKFELLLPLTTDDHQRVSIRILLAEAMSRSLKNSEWRTVVLAWLETAARHELTHPQLAAYVLGRAESATKKNGSDSEASLIRQERQQKFPDWQNSVAD